MSETKHDKVDGEAGLPTEHRDDIPEENGVLIVDVKTHNTDCTHTADCSGRKLCNGNADNTELEDKGLPIDRGWAWVILICATVCYFVLIGQMKCFGIVFVQLQERFHSSSSDTSLIFTVQNATYSLSALLILTLGSSMSCRTSVIIGTLISSTTYIISAFLTDIGPAYLFLGMLVGLSNAMIFPQVTAMISVYFEKRRGFANSIAHTGVSIGGLAFAPIITKLFETYAFTGTYMYVAGFHLHLMIVACLLRPMSFYEKKGKRAKNGNEEEIALLKKDTEDTVKEEHSEQIHDTSMCIGKGSSYLLKRALSHQDQSSEVTVHRRKRTASAGEHDVPKMESTLNSFFESKMARFASTDVVNSSLYDLALSQDVQNEETGYKRTTKDKKDMYISTIRSAMLRLGARLFDVKLLSKPHFLYYLVCNLFLCPGSSLANSFLPTHAFEMGVDKDSIAWMVSGMCIVDFLSRFVFGFFSDKGWCKRSTLISISVIIMGTASQFLYFMTTFRTMLIYAAISGFLQGVYFSLYVVVILDILPFQNLKGALGFVSLIQGISTSLALPCAGYLRDYSGYYFLTHNFIGGFLILGGVLLYFLPYVSEWNKRREAEKDRRKENDKQSI